ncbi:MAG TPA: V-type ATP synthase subunit F [Phycisphaerae bacterium]|nr:V-type ATP synthase subunit F [Phycisphaerae bacterium]
MKFFCVADEDTVRGFRLAGVDGQAVATAGEADRAIRRAAGRPDLGILILTDAVAADVRELVDDVRMNRSQPLIVEIPGPQGPMPGRKTLRQLVQEAVGIRLGQEESSA